MERFIDEVAIQVNGRHLLHEFEDLMDKLVINEDGCFDKLKLGREWNNLLTRYKAAESKKNKYESYVERLSII
jgi:hypothetical protein